MMCIVNTIVNIMDTGYFTTNKNRGVLLAYRSNGSLGSSLCFLRISVLFFLIILQACSSKTMITGNLPDPDLIANIEVGVVTKNEVFELLGSPSSKATFNDDTWYYVSERTSTKAFYAPEVIDRKILIVEFDKRKIVKNIKQLSLKDGKNIEMIDRVTPTAGKELTILKQIFGNVGRFESNDKPK
jgi:outer membrane protein assembly factor BamE (lipoprotein component of BamABCDE complex)